MPGPPTDDLDDAQLEDVRRRVLYALLSPVARLGFLFGVPLRGLGELVQMASFHETRRRGLKTGDVAARLGVSPRKVALLSKLLKRNFLEGERGHSLPRRIEFMLWAGPLSAARMKQVLTEHDDGEIEAALDQLEQQARIRRVPGRTERFEVVGAQYRLVSRDWLARLDGLDNLMASVANVVFARFFKGERRAFARTVSLRVRDADIARLEALYAETIWPALVALDEAAHDDPESRSMDISILWAPYEYTQDFEPGGGDE